MSERSLRIQGKKIGRNQPCICGSGAKFKRCCGSFVKMRHLIERNEKILSEAQAKKILKEQQQGLGRPIISTLYDGHRIVAVAGTVYWSKKWMTFIDFLNDYIKNVLSSKWGDSELTKAFEQRHPIIQWHNFVCKQQKESIKVPGKVFSITPNGATHSYIHLAYNLYLLAHNQPTDTFSQKLQQVIIKRLKQKDQFSGAYYETYVYAMLIKAGFSIELEDEKQSATTHCECVATHRNSGRKYSVEAKSIRRKDVLGVKDNYTSKDLSGSIRDQIYKSLKKSSKFPRIIFIDVNLPHDIHDEQRKVPGWVDIAVDVSKRSETNLTIDGKKPDPAYVIFTNHPVHHDLDGAFIGCSAVAVGFNIDNFGYGAIYNSLRERYNAKQEHLDIEELIYSIEIHQEPPVTFEPELPSHKFSNDKIVALKIGHNYHVPDSDGVEVVGTLVDAVVIENNKLVYGIYKIHDDNKMIMATSPITDEELEDYKKYPDVFFGVYRKQSRKPLSDIYEVFEWLLSTYTMSSKEQLLDFMKAAPDIDELRLKNQNELVLIYCERVAASILGNK